MAPYGIFLGFRISLRKPDFYSGIPATIKIGAGDGARTRYLSLGKAALYQMSYSRKKNWCLRVDLNHRHRDFQSLALPTELPRHKDGDPEGARTPDLQRDRLAY